MDAARSTATIPDSSPVWQRRFPGSSRWDAEIETSTIPELLARGCVAANGPVLDFRGRSIGFPEFSAGVDRLAAGLIAAGLAPG